jgi:Fur family ferric uptake transcriptional regulator
MCQLPSIESSEYVNIFSIIKKRFEKHNQKFTINKQIIFRILYENSEHLSVEEIIVIANKYFAQSLNYSTVYRILAAFEMLGIVDNIVLDDKKRFELIYFKQPHYHLYCQECNKVMEFESLDIHELFLAHLKSINFKPTNFNVIINGVCDKCQN